MTKKNTTLATGAVMTGGEDEGGVVIYLKKGGEDEKIGCPDIDHS